MKNNPYLETKTALTPAEKLKVAYAVLINGWDQHEVAALMGVNPGRVNEAVMAVRKAIDPEGTKAEAAAKAETAKKPSRRVLGRGLDRAPVPETTIPGILHGDDAEASQRPS
jgi:hypothetical protein